MGETLKKIETENGRRERKTEREREGDRERERETRTIDKLGVNRMGR